MIIIVKCGGVFLIGRIPNVNTFFQEVKKLFKNILGMRHTLTKIAY